jgi:hypothetical protein
LANLVKQIKTPLQKNLTKSSQKFSYITKKLHQNKSKILLHYKKLHQNKSKPNCKTKKTTVEKNRFAPQQIELNEMDTKVVSNFCGQKEEGTIIEHQCLAFLSNLGRLWPVPAFCLLFPNFGSIKNGQAKINCRKCVIFVDDLVCGLFLVDLKNFCG